MSKRHWTLNYYRAIKVMMSLVREDKEKIRYGSRRGYAARRSLKSIVEPRWT
jgi:hypothetical protein